MAGVVADIFAVPTYVNTQVEVATGFIASIQATIASIQSMFMTAAYAAAIPLVAIEFRGIVDIIIGIGQTFWGTLESLDIIVSDLFTGVLTFGTFLITNIICLAKGIGTLPQCIFFYIFDTFVQLLYLPIRLVLWFAKSFLKINLYPIQDKIWNLVKKFNDFFYKIAKFDLIYWPTSIRNKCYNCKRLKVAKVVQVGSKINSDVMNEIAPRLWPGIQNIMKGGNEMMHPFD
jgi:hypothetical protein